MSWVARDIALIAAAFAASVVLGISTNVLRRVPLPMLYKNPEARVLSAVSPAAAITSGEPEVLEYKVAVQTWKASAALFVDARNPPFFEEGHIPRSINLPRDSIVQAGSIAALADKARPLVVYCSGEDCDDSRIVAKGLLAMGYSKVSVYSGGWEEWSASGSPVEK
ncbi:MAG: rhodanese-like domain-containing protein [Verrucomicrobia bacterium]|nr:rhodanese-like domain-containing protein [Verrucomicrobiota bacterium]